MGGCSRFDVEVGGLDHRGGRKVELRGGPVGEQCRDRYSRSLVTVPPSKKVEFKAAAGKTLESVEMWIEPDEGNIALNFKRLF